MSDDVPSENNGEEESFADLLESYSPRMKKNIQVGDKISGKIIGIGRDTVFVDTGTKSDGIVDKEELLDKGGQLPYKEGDMIELYVVSSDGSEIRLSRALSGIGGLAALEDAFEKGVPVEGKVKALVKGGFHVDIMQRRAFCPISQMEMKFVEKPDEYVGETYRFLITQLEDNGKNIVLSRRKLLDKEQEKAKKAFLKDVAIGAELEGRVSKLMPYGAFVELFPGVEGMVHISELSWSRVEKPHEIMKVGDLVAFKVIGMEEGSRPDRPKISLSIKQVTEDPWESVGEKFHEGDKVTGKVTRCANFGAFVEIEPGIEGLVHVSEMSYISRVLKPEDVVKAGDTVSVVIKEIDAANRKISLSIKDAEGDPWLDAQNKYRVGQAVDGQIEKKEKFGYFVTLEPGITGLLPISEIRKSHEPTRIEKLREGDAITIIVEKIKADERKITVRPGDSREVDDWRRFADDSKKSLGSLGEKLQRALESKKDAS